MVKKKENPRALKFWDTEHLYSTMITASEINHGIEALANKEQKDLFDLQPILVPADVLWVLTDAFIDAYERLMQESLIKSGNICKIQPTLN